MMPKPSRKKRRATPLKKHRRSGSVLQPPFRTLPNVQPTNWLRDSVPDLVWPAYVIADGREQGLSHFSKAQQLIAGIFPEETGASAAPAESSERSVAVPYDGRLTSLEPLHDDDRRKIITLLNDNDIFEVVVPERLAHVLGMYPDAPGRWLVEPWFERGLSVDPAEAQKALALTLSECWHGQTQVSTWVKAILFGAALISRKMLFARDFETLELLPRYPQGLTKDELARAEGFIRASAQALCTPTFLGAERADVIRAWAQQFWRANWQLYPCQPPDLGSAAPLDRGEFIATAQSVADEIEAARETFVKIAETTDPDLFGPDRHEVLTGLVARTIRLISQIPTAPALWTDDVLTFVLRAVLETRIVFEWLVRKDESELFEQFKDYGRGRLKLLKLHWEDYLESLDDPPEDLLRHVETLQEDLDAIADEEWQDVNVSENFVKGMDRRKMADEVGMASEYRLLFQPLSDAAHGDWSTIQRSAMVRCVNPAHRGHWIPDKGYGLVVRSDLVSLALDQMDAIVNTYRQVILGPAPLSGPGAEDREASQPG